MINATSTNRTANVDTAGYQGANLGPTVLASTTSTVQGLDSQAGGILSDIDKNQRASDELRGKQTDVDNMLQQLGPTQDSGWVTGSDASAAILGKTKPDGYGVPTSNKDTATANLETMKHDGTVTMGPDDSAIVTDKGTVVFQGPNAQANAEAYAQAHGGTAEPAFTAQKSDLTAKKDDLGAQIQSLSTRNETNNLQLQYIMHQRQEALELASSILKSINDATMSIIKNIA